MRKVIYKTYRLIKRYTLYKFIPETPYPLNFLVLGNTGAGKSALVNYLFGLKKASTGAGKPVTGCGIYSTAPFRYKNMEIVVHDSFGLEPGKEKEWREAIGSKVRKNNALEVRDWFHTIIYCIDAKRSRVDDYEIQVIQELFNNGNRLVFALTKTDVASPDEIDAVEAILKSHGWNLPITRICSQKRRLFGGKKTELQGRDELLVSRPLKIIQIFELA